MIEQTFAIIKPRAVVDREVGQIIDMIEKAGFNIACMQKTMISKDQAHELYVEHMQRSFFGEMVNGMTSSPVIIMKLEKENGVQAWRDLMGATDPSKAAAGTIRARFGKNIGENATHGSDSAASASRELAIFFKNQC